MAKLYPETVEEMAPLYAAVRHGCEAGWHEEALEVVYRQRIQRAAPSDPSGAAVVFSGAPQTPGANNGDYNTSRLGALGAELSMLRHFFVEPWVMLAADLPSLQRMYVFNEAGFALRQLGRLRDAVAPLEAAHAIAAEYGMPSQHSRVAMGLFEWHLAGGDLARAREYAEVAIAAADTGGSPDDRCFARTGLGAVLQRLGHAAQAEAVFVEAEAIMIRGGARARMFISRAGDYYHALLLDQRRYGEVRERAAYALAKAKEGGLLPDQAWAHRALGEAYAVSADEGGDPNKAAAHLNDAIIVARRAGVLIDVPGSLIARAAWRRNAGDLEGARADLEEARTLAAAGPMRLDMVDSQLACARLHLDQGDADTAAAILTAAETTIRETGYGRRDGELRALCDRVRDAVGNAATNR